MTVAAVIRVPSLSVAAYDASNQQLAPMVKKQPGFIMHVAYPTPDGFYVGEIWESRGQFETWFNENVLPNVPAQIDPEVTELHAVLQP